MGDSLPVLIISSVILLIWGIASLYSNEVFWGKVFTYWGSDLVMKGRIPARVHGFPVTAGGALGIVTAGLDMFGADAEVVKTLLWICILLVLAGLIGSFAASCLGYGDEEQDPATLERAMRSQHGDRYGRW